MTTEAGDIYLIEAVQRGDESAWREIIERYEGRLLSFAKRRLADRDIAEDLVQETFLGLLRSLSSYDAKRALETYLFAILRNKLTDHFRRSGRGPFAGKRESLDALPIDDAAQAWLDPETPSHYAAAREGIDAQRQALVEALRQWVQHCQTQRRFQDLIVIEMLVVLGLRNKEVAADLELPEPAIAGIKFRVLDQWKKAAQTQQIEHTFGEADLAEDSSLAKIWREEGISCLKRSTLGKASLGVLDEEWSDYIEFHTGALACERCLANLDDLHSEELREPKSAAHWREQIFASSVGFLSKRPD
jgi:RNA polymerase sigma-70 factor (ECF subfamily)